MRAARGCGVVLLMIAALPAQAGVVDIAWSAEGRFEHVVQVEPGRFVEVCGALPAGQSVRWQFEAGRALDFNVHYHVGKEVAYPERRKGLRRAEGVLAVPAAQDYCWMWSNKSSGRARVDVRLQRQN